MSHNGGEWLIGRDVELSLVRQALDAARRTGAGLILEGEAGIGKSALARALGEEATGAGFTVLGCRPAESETTYAYAALGDLVGHLFDEYAQDLPSPQRTALARALHRDAADVSPVEAATPGTVAVATVGLLQLAAANGPLCLVVDDVQWLDDSSEEVLRFAVRRLPRPGVLLVVARRGQSAGQDPLGVRMAFGHDRVVELRPRGLSMGAMHAVLHRDLGLSLPRARLVQLHTLTRGNPLFGLEIGRALAARELSPTAEEPLPVPDSLAQLLSARIGAGPPAAADVLRILSMADRPTFETLVAVAGSADEAQHMLDTSIAARVIEVEADRIRPAHPLLASVAYAATDIAQRRQMHRLLADAEAEPESRARHLALAAPGQSEEVAEALQLAAAAARQRGATDTAAELLVMAVNRTPRTDGTTLRSRQLLLGEALFDSGDLIAARGVADELLAAGVEPDLAGRLALLRATLAWYLESSSEAVRYLGAALESDIGDPALLGRIHMHMAVFVDFDMARSLHHAHEAVSALEQGMRGDPSLGGSLATALCQLFYGEVLLGRPPRLELIERAVGLEPPGGQFEGSTVPGIWWAAIDRIEDAQRRFEGMLQRAQDSGDRSGEADLLTRLAEVAVWAGRWGRAAELAGEATAVAQQEGQEFADPAQRVRALVDAYTGHLDRAQDAAQASLDRLEPAGDHILAAAWLVVATLVAVTRGDAVRIEQLTARSAAHLSNIGIREPLRLDLTGERVAALCTLGRLEEASVLLDELAARHERIPRPSLFAAIVRAHALLASARGQLAEGIEATQPVTSEAALAWPAFERGRTLLVRGQLLRRTRNRREAREVLQAALATFEALGARAWAEQVIGELARLGQYRPGTEELTPTEREVAVLAASGLATRDVAARLFVSPKTIEAHLSHIYAKLGISSRAELGARMGSATED